MRAAVIALAVVGALASLGGRALAYPQFQMSRDQTCTGCHISPSGGGLLNENGQNVAEQMSTWGTNPEVLNGVLPLPKWLSVGGDFRAAGGYDQTPEKTLSAFPMQAELYGDAKLPGGFSIHVTAGVRDPQEGNTAATILWSREHYVMWHSNPDGNDGFYVRAGRFMPIFGLRLAEHPDYTRRYGGTPLYGETYGVAAEYITPKWEAHVTGFIKDPLIDPVEHDNGVAALAELRLTEHVSIGGEGMVQVSDDDKKYRGGVLAKWHIPAADLLLQGEVQFVNQEIDAGGAPNQIVGYLLASRPIGDAFLIDVGVGHYDENIRIADLDRDCVDVNIHWFMTSHIELMLTNRYEMIGWGDGGPSGGYSLLMAHYRL
ncbi:MAG TPA: hypothetical protein VGM88_01745 [Kofleriaceae bacterium]|jgi:hypothetical protein